MKCLHSRVIDIILLNRDFDREHGINVDLTLRSIVGLLVRKPEKNVFI